MNIPDILHKIGETVRTSATVKSVYGEPVVNGQRTVIPVANIRFAFGGGGGAEGDPDHPQRGGGGGGGHVSARPAGVVEVSPEGVRFLYFQDRERLAAAVAIGFLAGFAIGLLRGRRNRESV